MTTLVFNRDLSTLPYQSVILPFPGRQNDRLTNVFNYTTSSYCNLGLTNLSCDVVNTNPGKERSGV